MKRSDKIREAMNELTKTDNSQFAVQTIAILEVAYQLAIMNERVETAQEIDFLNNEARGDGK